MLRHVLLVLIVLLVPAFAQAEIPEGTIKIGVLQNLPGPYAGETGNGGIVAAQMAAAAFETQYLRGDAEILPHVSRGDVQEDLKKVREWLDVEHVAAVVSSAPSVVNRRIAEMVAKRHVTLLVTATDSGMDGSICSPDAVVWAPGPDARARALAQAVVPQGGKKWFVVAEQSPGGLAGQQALQQAVSASGGTVVGTKDHPVGEADMRKASSDIAKSQAQVLALSESDGDLISALRSAQLAGLSGHMTLVAPYAQTTDVDDAGPAVAAGLMVPTPFYWDTNKQTRQFAIDWSKRMQGMHVTENAAAVYAATLSFLHAAKAVEDIDARNVLPKLRQAPIKHTLFGTVTIRHDGRAVYDMDVYRVKQPGQVQHRWAYYTKVATIPGARAFPSDACKGNAAGQGR